MIPEHRFQERNWALLERKEALKASEEYRSMKHKLFSTFFTTAGVGPSFIQNFSEVWEGTDEDERIGNLIAIRLICNSIEIKSLNQDTPLPKTAEVRHVIFIDHQNKNGLVPTEEIFDGLNGWYEVNGMDRFQIIYDRKFEIRPGQVVETDRTSAEVLEWESNVVAGQTQTTPVDELIALINAMPGGVGTTDGTQIGIRVGTFSARKEITTGTSTGTSEGTAWVNGETTKSHMMALEEKRNGGQGIRYTGPFGTDIAGVGIFERIYVNDVPMAIEIKTRIYYEDL